MSEATHYTVHYHVNWTDRPVAEPCHCQHEGPMAFPINLRIEPRGRGGRNEIVHDGILCLDCGDDPSGQLDLVEGLTAGYAQAMERVIRPFVLRIYDLVEHRRAELAGRPIPLWMAVPLGLSCDEINEGLRAARVQRAAEYMGARVARYAEPRA